MCYQKLSAMEQCGSCFYFWLANVARQVKYFVAHYGPQCNFRYYYLQITTENAVYTHNNTQMGEQRRHIDPANVNTNANSLTNIINYQLNTHTHAHTNAGDTHVHLGMCAHSCFNTCLWPATSTKRQAIASFKNFIAYILAQMQGMQERNKNPLPKPACLPACLPAFIAIVAVVACREKGSWRQTPVGNGAFSSSKRRRRRRRR